MRMYLDLFASACQTTSFTTRVLRTFALRQLCANRAGVRGEVVGRALHMSLVDMSVGVRMRSLCVSVSSIDGHHVWVRRCRHVVHGASD